MTVEVFAFPKNNNKPTFKKTMSYAEFKELKSKDYDFRAYQINYNTTII
jgi:hypothetical protein